MASTTREQLLAATGRLLQRRGFHGASLNEILKESGAPRGSLYFHFPGGKAQLAAEATRAEVAEATRIFEASFAENADPAEAIRASFEEMAQYVEKSDFTLGCPIAPLVLDAGGDDPELSAISRAGFAEWKAIIQRGLERAGVEKRRAAGLATLVLAAEEGAILLARADRDVAPLRAAADGLARLVRDAVPKGGRARPRGRR